ncbi:MAG: CPBP family intramembrane metalloprotease [Verrucomicrobia bacterium]|nr:MAG: CPBP family intramembrane metalloprotease [Verrucomicrobiota bacterium]
MKFLAPREATPAVAGWRIAGWVVGLILVATVLAAITSVTLVRFILPHLPAAWSDAVLHRGAGKIMVRAMQVWVVLLLPLWLRSSGWRGWRDCGWQGGPFPHPLWQDILGGFAVGVATLGGLALFMFMTGHRVAGPLDTTLNSIAVFISFALSATAVAVFEETLARGIIFRLWARAWGAVAAALASSLLFAIAHFIQPSAAAFAVPGFWSAVGSLSLNALQPDMSEPAFLIRLLNLTCLGLTLCAMVRLTGSIWLAVGAHAGWVWSIKINNFFTDAAPVPWRSPLWGARGDLTDSAIGMTTLLIVLLGVLWVHRRRTCRE